MSALCWHLQDNLHIRMHIGFMMLYKLRMSFCQSVEPEHMCNSSNSKVLHERLKPKWLKTMIIEKEETFLRDVGLIRNPGLHTHWGQ